MKTSELIAELKRLDPSEECEVNVRGLPIHFVGRDPAYYDGPVNELIEDPAKKPYYAIVGWKKRRNGPDKIVVHTVDLEDCLLENPDLPVTFEGFKDVLGPYEKGVEALRAQCKKDLAE